MSLAMPERRRPTCSPAARRSRRILRAIVPGEGVVVDTEALRPFETDGLTAYRQLPMLVVLPETVEQVSRVLRYCYDNGIRVVPRGSGTSLSGGALPLEDGVLLVMSKFNKVLDIDFDNRCVVGAAGRHQSRRDQRRRPTAASTMRPTPRRRSPARSAATWRRIPAACTA